MNKLRNLFMVLVLVFGLAAAIPAAAEMDKKMEHGKSGMGHHEMKHGKSSKMGHQGGHGAKHIFGSHWRETLTDNQKMQADRIHLEMKKSLSVQDARLKVKKAELNNLVVKDDPDTKAIHRKIDEVLELKREIMRTKYDHMVEMRGALTPEQRVSFDMGLLSRDGLSKGHRRH
ncbi:MAG: periplasmic heavy metal sensor [Nitrospinota bacterium]